MVGDAGGPKAAEVVTSFPSSPMSMEDTPLTGFQEVQAGRVGAAHFARMLWANGVLGIYL